MWSINYPKRLASKPKTVHVNLLKIIQKLLSSLPVLLVTEDDNGHLSASIDRNSPIEIDTVQKQQLDDILSSFPDVFSAGLTTIASHSIEISCKTPILSSSYPIPIKLEEQFQLELNNLLELDVI